VIALIDSSKFQSKGIKLIAALPEIDTLITDSGVPADTLHEIRATGVNVIVVDRM
jgi:DeoR/GlpR family transcriptional regulator of sugar metabolism